MDPLGQKNKHFVLLNSGIRDKKASILAWVPQKADLTSDFIPGSRMKAEVGKAEMEGEFILERM